MATSSIPNHNNHSHEASSTANSAMNDQFDLRKEPASHQEGQKRVVQNGDFNSRRDIESLYDWATRSGVKFAPGTQLVQDASSGEWGVKTIQSQDQGVPIVSIPTQLILSSQDYDERGPLLQEWIASTMKYFNDGKQQQQQQNYNFLNTVPECLLMLRLLEECSRGPSSSWFTWLDSLPLSFSTAMYMDDFEKSLVRQMAPRFVEQQESQWNSCKYTILSLVRQEQRNLVSPEFFEWLSIQPNLEEILRWAFTVIYTRSWRDPTGRHATIVPMGDLFNHDSQKANIKPCLRDGYLQLCASGDVSVNSNPDLYLSYGSTDYPGRFLVVFGFCDMSAPYVEAHMDHILEEATSLSSWPLIDTTQLVVSTTNGVISSEVWNVFLYKVLEELGRYDTLQQIQQAFDQDDEEGDALAEELLDNALLKWEKEVSMELRRHFQYVLDTIYPPLSVKDMDFYQHPHLTNIVNYNMFLRETFLCVLEHVNSVLRLGQKLG